MVIKVIQNLTIIHELYLAIKITYSSNVRLYGRKGKKVTYPDLGRHKDYVAVSIPIKSNHRCSGRCPSYYDEELRL